jgi:peptidoglycan DL-endopeptidase CwlO
MRARAAVAAVTTGTVAVSGVALAGCATSGPSDSGTDEVAATSPLNLSAQLGSEASLAAFRAAGSGATVANVSDVTGQLAAQSGLHGKSVPVLAVTNPTVTVRANQPVNMGFSLRDQSTGTPLANQLVKVQVKQAAGWTTFKYLYTDAKGYTSYTARVLTTTQITAVFDGSDGYRSTHATNVGTLTVAPVPVAPTQASRTTARTALTASASVAATVPASSLGERPCTWPRRRPASPTSTVPPAPTRSTARDSSSTCSSSSDGACRAPRRSSTTRPPAYPSTTSRWAT